MRAKLFAICDLGLLDAHSNSLSLINLMLDIQAAAFPIGIPRLAFVGIFERNDGEPETVDFPLRVLLNGEEIAALPMHLDFQGKQYVQSIGLIQGLIVANPGTLRFIVAVGDMNSTWDISVQTLGPPHLDLFAQVALPNN